MSNQCFISYPVRLRYKGTMKPPQLTVDNGVKCCAKCGWPGVGSLPVGVRTVNQNGHQMIIGQLSYFRIHADVCSVCREMLASVESRPWFVKAHGEYLSQVEVKKRLLAER